MGFTFKENCPDTRNTKIADLVGELKPLVAELVIYDPHADPEEALHEYGIVVQKELPLGRFDTVVLCRTPRRNHCTRRAGRTSAARSQARIRI